MFENNDMLLHLLGYLTEDQWIDAFGQQDFQDNKDSVKEYAQVVARQYNMTWSDKMKKVFKFPQ